MRVALVDGVRALAAPSLNAVCPICKGLVIARCGAVRVHHWAHRSERDCDHWWEPRTPWHVDWQDKFPLEWQEIVRTGASRKQHRADVHTPHGLTLEFQWSHLAAAMIASREAFYGYMVWVVAGARVPGNVRRLKEKLASLRPIHEDQAFLVRHPDEVFDRKWIACTKPVFFDFAGFKAALPETTRLIEPLWCLMPDRAGDEALVIKVEREEFVRAALRGASLVPAHLSGALETARTAMAVQRERMVKGEQRSRQISLHWQRQRSRRRAIF